MSTKRPRIAAAALATAAAVGDAVPQKIAGPPAHFARQFELIKLLRRGRCAPVDTMGCHALVDLTAPPEVQHYQILTALQLSSQTRDQETAKAMERLRAHGLSIDVISKTSVDQVREMIKTVGFYNRKAEFIKRTAEELVENHGGRVPNDLDALLALPGVGPKMAHLCMQCAFGVVSGISVDTQCAPPPPCSPAPSPLARVLTRTNAQRAPHLQRTAMVRPVSRPCGLTSHQLDRVKTKAPEETQRALELFVPRDDWGFINLELVGIGQMIKQPAYRPQLVRALAMLPAADRKEAGVLLQKLGFVMLEE